MARRIIYTVTKFVPPDRINEAAYLDLKNLFCIDPTYLVEPGHEKLFNKFKGEIIAVIIGSIFWILSLICKSALGYGTIVEILEAISFFPLAIGGFSLILSGPSYLGYIADKRKYYKKMKKDLMKSKDYIDFQSLFYFKT